MAHLTMKQILQYEGYSYWLTNYIWFNWGQKFIAWYIARKVLRKYKRYLYSLEITNILQNLKNQ